MYHAKYQSTPAATFSRGTKCLKGETILARRSATTTIRKTVVLMMMMMTTAMIVFRPATTTTTTARAFSASVATTTLSRRKSIPRSIIVPQLSPRCCFSSCRMRSGCNSRALSSTTITTTTTTTTSLHANSNNKNDPKEPEVEVSPSDHGTTPLTNLCRNNVLDPRLQQYLQKSNFCQPTPIQAHAIPLLLHNSKNSNAKNHTTEGGGGAVYDVMASAQTGSGKTLMFALPMCHKLFTEATTKSNSKKSASSPAALILNPTRELAMQTEAVVKEILSASSSSSSNNKNNKTQLRTALAVGGMQSSVPRHVLQQQAENFILVGTPGRILQYIDERVISLRDTQYVVIDEADRMLDLGFEPQLRRIARALQPKGGGGGNNKNDDSKNNNNRQTVLCSATFPPEVQRIAADFLKPDYFFVAAGRVGGMHNRIEQSLLWVGSGDKQRRQIAVAQVRSFLQQEQQEASSQMKEKKRNNSVIVFCNKKDDAEELGKTLGRQTCCVVTGDKTQQERNKSLQQFRQGKIPVLVATDVAARGLHVDHVGLVVQADMPRDADTFVHRIGRTGRAGAQGQAIALVDGRSVGIAADLVKLLCEAQQPVPAWLWGMAYMAQARRLEEDQAILAGSGGISFNSGVSNTVQDDKENSFSNDLFSSQDFRKDAEVGSWGSGRDTSYHAFDDEAYSSLDDVSADVLEKFNQDDGGEVDQAGATNSSIVPESPSDAFSLDTQFKRQPPSKALLERLRQQTGQSDVGDNPDSQFFRSLSRGEDQILKFEYLGMFPFSNVSEMLTSRDSISQGSGGQSNLPTVLMVAEKPSIAKALAEALSGPRGPRQRKGISRALPVYEFTSADFVPEQRKGTNSRCRIIVTSVVGHVFSLGFVEETAEQDKNGFTDPSEFYRLPVVKKEEGSTGKLRVVDHLRALAAGCDHLVLWLDCDAEGENIAHEVIGVTRKALEVKVAQDLQENPEEQTIRRIHRARFSAITGDALRGAFKHLEEPDAALSRSVDARQELDLRVGVSMTRLLNWRCIGLARKYFSPSTKLVSYGPCQTPALSFCVERAKEIDLFQPKEYQKIDVALTCKGKTGPSFKPKWIVPASGVDDTLGDSATFDKVLARRTVEEVLDAGKFRIAHVREVPETRNAPLGLNTVALLTSASKAMGMSPKGVMNVAEKLYSAGLISYPRTETTRYDPTGFDVRSVLREHQSHPEWGRTASYLLRGKYSNSGRPPLRGKDAGDHPPITPLKAANRDEVGGGNSWRVYDFITRNFLGSLSDDLRYIRRVAELEALDATGASTGPKFELEQLTIDSLGFAGACRWVLNDIGASPKSNSSDDTIVFKKGMEFFVKDAKSISSQTRPPRFLQEHELVQLMDQHRIGTDASMATHINNIVDRGYVILCDETGVPLRPPRPPRPGQSRPPRQIGRYMVPTSLGMSLLDIFHKAEGKPQSPSSSSSSSNHETSLSLLAKPAIRAQMEDEVKQIAVGSMNKKDCLVKNLDWFEARYHELFKALSKNRVDAFGRSLCPTQDSLKYWRKVGAFEKATTTTAASSPKSKYKGSKKVTNKTRGAKKVSNKNNNNNNNSRKTKNKHKSSPQRKAKQRVSSGDR